MNVRVTIHLKGGSSEVFRMYYQHPIPPPGKSISDVEKKPEEIRTELEKEILSAALRRANFYIMDKDRRKVGAYGAREISGVTVEEEGHPGSP